MRLIGIFVLLIMFSIILSGCSHKFDGFDPTTATVRWIINYDKKPDKRSLER